MSGKILDICRIGTILWLGLLANMGAAMAGTVLHESLPSPTLGRDYRFTVYLPDGYEGSGLNYPVVYLLHGAKGDENDWLVKGKIRSTLDRLISARRIQPVIAVMPGHKSMWWVDAHAEQAETVLLKELLPTIEKRFRTLPEREGRAFAGLSAGGYATIRLALRHPDLFAAGAALSPAIYEPEPPANSSAVTDPPFQKDGRFDREIWLRLNWRNQFDAYASQPLRVPLYLNSGDRDRFDIAFHAAEFHRMLRATQPDKTVFRVVDGDHEWPVWEHSIGDALEYTLSYLRAPSPLPAKPAN